MTTLLISLLLIILISEAVEQYSKVPTTLCIVVLSILINLFFPNLFNISPKEFDETIYLMLPVILLPDILNLSVNELKRIYKEIIYLAVIAVIVSIAIASLIAPYLMPAYAFSAGTMIALFAMLMATDAITVSSIMSKFDLPEKLKIYTESESLFNDVTALIIFYFVAVPMLTGETIHITSIQLTLLKVLALSTAIGVVTAYIGYLMMKILKEPIEQFIIIYLIVVVSFLVAEHFHIAGILSIVSSVITFKLLIQKEMMAKSSKIDVYDYMENADGTLYGKLKSLIQKVPAITKREFRGYKKEAYFIGVFANAVVFVAIANLFDFQTLFTYKTEILIVFLLTSVIRFFFMGSFALYMKFPFNWAKTLTFAGSKGALAVIMAHSLPVDFVYRDLFEAVVIGNIILSMFIYTFILMIHIYKNQNSYKNDKLLYDEDIDSEESSLLAVQIKNAIEKDPISRAYTRPFLNNALEDEINRSIRYKLELSLIMIEITNAKNIEDINNSTILMGKVVNKKIRNSDYFGMQSKNKYLVILTNTSLGGAVILAERIEHKLIKKNENRSVFLFGITSLSETDTKQMLFEKLEDAIEEAKQDKTKKIEVEF